MNLWWALLSALDKEEEAPAQVSEPQPTKGLTVTDELQYSGS